MKQFTIIEEKWARGGKNGDSMLENEQGYRCCLGFLCLAAGAKTVVGLAMPGGAANENPEIIPTLGKLVDAPPAGCVTYATSNKAWGIAFVNDDKSISDEARKAKLALLFEAFGWEAIYV